MKATVEQLFRPRTRRMLRLTRVRIASQVVFFVLFVLAVWATWTSRIGGYPVSRLLEVNPLVIGLGFGMRF